MLSVGFTLRAGISNEGGVSTEAITYAHVASDLGVMARGGYVYSRHCLQYSSIRQITRGFSQAEKIPSVQKSDRRGQSGGTVHAWLSFIAGVAPIGWCAARLEHII